MHGKSAPKYKKAYKAYVNALLGKGAPAPAPSSPARQPEKLAEKSKEEEPPARASEPKGQYEHFSVQEDFQFIECLTQFKNTAGFRTRQGYFDRLAEQFGRTLCSIRRRWERLNVLTQAQKELVLVYHTKYAERAAQRRIVFAKNCANVSLLTMDGPFIIPEEEHSFFRKLKAEFLQIEPSCQSDFIYQEEISAGEEIALPSYQLEAIGLVPEGRDSPGQELAEPDAEGQPPAPVLEVGPVEEISSSESVVLEISGNEEEVLKIQPGKKRTVAEEEAKPQLFWNRHSKGLSECHSSLSDALEDAIEVQEKQAVLGQKRELVADFSAAKAFVVSKKIKADSIDPSTATLKQKIQSFKENLGQPDLFVNEKAALLRALLENFANQYECDLEVIKGMIPTDKGLNMEELKFKMCMSFLNKRHKNEK